MEINSFIQLTTYSLLISITTFIRNSSGMNMTTNATSSNCLNFLDVGFEINSFDSLIFRLQCQTKVFIRLSLSTKPSPNDYIITIANFPSYNNSIGLLDNYQFFSMSYTMMTSSNPFLTSYWISWENGIIMVGYGSVLGLSSFIVYNEFLDPSSTFRFMSLCSQCNATWIFDDSYYNFPSSDNETKNATIESSQNITLNNQTTTSLTVPQTGLYFLTKNGSNEFNDTGADLRGFDWVTFGVRSCCEARIALTANGFQTNQAAYEVILQGNANNSNISTELSSNVYMDYYVTPDILSCNSMNWFWISWTNGLIMVGKGSEKDVDVFMVLMSTINIIPLQMGIGTFSCSSGEWIIPDIYYHNNCMKKLLSYQ